MSDITFSPVIVRGAQWLDEHAPADWVQRINTDTLNMLNSCVLDQVFRDEGCSTAGYSWAYDTYDLCERTTIRGFSARAYTPDDDLDGWDALTEAWKQHLTQEGNDSEA